MRALILLFCLTLTAVGQAPTRDLGSGGSSVGLKPSAPREPVIVNLTAISPERDWTNLEGKVINARLISFTDPPPGESGPITVVQGGKVRLLLTATRETTDYPLEQLSKPDRGYVETVQKGVAAAEKAASPE